MTPALWLQLFPSAATVHEQMNFGTHEIMNSIHAREGAP